MPKVKRKSQGREKLTHNECRMRGCIWCGKKRSPGSLRPLNQAQLLLVQKHGDASLDPTTDDQLPKAICTSCRLGLSALENEDSGIRYQLPDLFDYG